MTEPPVMDLTASEPPLTPRIRKASALAALATRMGVEPDAMFLSSLKSVAFQAPSATTEQLLALCVVANQYGLNPFTKELYAFPAKGGGVVPIVSVDGWSRILNEQPNYDGMEFLEDEAGAWIECVIYRKDRRVPLRAREYLAECKRNTDPWRSHPRRMLRHKAMIQAARMAFGFAGIYDADEAERILEVKPAGPVTVGTATERLKQVLAAEGPGPVVVIVPEAHEVPAGGDVLAPDEDFLKAYNQESDDAARN